MRETNIASVDRSAGGQDRYTIAAAVGSCRVRNGTRARAGSTVEPGRVKENTREHFASTSKARSIFGSYAKGENPYATARRGFAAARCLVITTLPWTFSVTFQVISTLRPPAIAFHAIRNKAMIETSVTTGHTSVCTSVRVESRRRVRRLRDRGPAVRRRYGLSGLSTGPVTIPPSGVTDGTSPVDAVGDGGGFFGDI